MMLKAFVLGYLLAVASAAAMPLRADEMADALDGTVWTDIGLGRNLTSITPEEIAQMRACHGPTMAFRKSGNRWVQIFYAGVEMRTVYSSASWRRKGANASVLLYSTDKSAPADVLHLSYHGEVMVEQSRGFRPHTYLRCRFSSAKPDVGKNR